MVRVRCGRRVQRNAGRVAIRAGGFAEQVIPIFRKRGLFRTEYTGQTLRDHYGIPRTGDLAET
jgi:hypothetical protein